MGAEVYGETIADSVRLGLVVDALTSHILATVPPNPDVVMAYAKEIARLREATAAHWQDDIDLDS